jgi:hypothetical protein
LLNVAASFTLPQYRPGDVGAGMAMAGSSMTNTYHMGGISVHVPETVASAEDIGKHVASEVEKVMRTMGSYTDPRY